MSDKTMRNPGSSAERVASSAGAEPAASPASAAARPEPFPYFGPAVVVVLGVIGWGIVHSATSPVLLSSVVPALISAIFATGVGFLIRQNGWVSFGHAAYFGLPAYAAGFAFNNGLFSPEVAVVGSVVGVGLLAFLIALVIGRTSGVALSMLTLAIGQAFYEWSTKERAVGGSDGLTVNAPASLFGLPGSAYFNRTSMFAICWGTLLVIIIVLELIAHSPFGKLTEAIRDNEERVRFLGYRTLIHRVTIFTISACVTAVAGILSLLNNGFISPDSLHWTKSGMALIMALLGGVARVWGPLLGAVVYFVLRDYVGDATEHWLAVVGTGLIVVIVGFPSGLSGLLVRITSGFPPLARLVAPKARPS